MCLQNRFDKIILGPWRNDKTLCVKDKNVFDSIQKHCCSRELYAKCLSNIIDQEISAYSA